LVIDQAPDVQRGEQAAVDLAEESARPGWLVAVLDHDHDRAVHVGDRLVQPRHRDAVLAGLAGRHARGDRPANHDVVGCDAADGAVGVASVERAQPEGIQGVAEGRGIPGGEYIDRVRGRHRVVSLPQL
jgi:hypothetical protein